MIISLLICIADKKSKPVPYYSRATCFHLSEVLCKDSKPTLPWRYETKIVLTKIKSEIMEIISFKKKAFEEVAAKLDYFIRRMDNLCRLHGEKKAGIWKDNHAVCQ